MHEISLCENLRELIEDQAATQNFRQVTCIWLEVGPFSCVEPDALRFGFDAVMRGSVAEGAELQIDTPPGRGTCAACGASVEVTDRFAACPECGLPGLQIIGGNALRLARIEVV